MECMLILAHGAECRSTFNTASSLPEPGVSAATGASAQIERIDNDSRPFSILVFLHTNALLGASASS
jgi:hypothetical protein